MSRVARAAILFATTAALPLAMARADEGMWTFDAFPAARMQAAYGFAPDQAWLDRVRASAVRLTGGCSASFVSGEGLISPTTIASRRACRTCRTPSAICSRPASLREPAARNPCAPGNRPKW